MDCCVNFGSQTICTTPSARCCDKDFLSNTHIGQPTAQNMAYIPGTGLFEVGLQICIMYMCVMCCLCVCVYLSELLLESLHTQGCLYMSV